MSGVSFPVTRPTGRALIVGGAACRAEPLAILQRMGFDCAEVDDPYAAMVELARRPLVYRALILCLNSLFREELAMIQTIKRRWRHVDIWLTRTDGRSALLAEGMRLGADGLLSDDGLHRTAAQATAAAPMPRPLPPPEPALSEPSSQAEEEPELAEPSPDGEPVLTADELRALLHEDHRES